MNHQQPSVRSGDKIEMFDGSNDHLMHERGFWNKIIAVTNAILRTNQWNITDGGVYFKNAAVQSTQTILPGTIYKIDNASSPAQSPFTFQIRDLLVGFRPSYVYPGYTIATLSQMLAAGNYETALRAIGTDNYIGGAGGISDLDNLSWNRVGSGADYSAAPTKNLGGYVLIQATDVLPKIICSNQLGTGNPSGIQIVINPSAGQTLTVSFFIKIIDDANGPYTELWATINDLVRNPPIANFTPALPNLFQTISLGSVTIDDLGNYTINQGQYGHLLNRYLEHSPKPTHGATSTIKFSGLPQLRRGRWTLHALSGKIFYPGDEVIDDTVQFNLAGFGGGNGVSCYKAYTYTGHNGDYFGSYINIETTAPNAASGGKWTPTSLAAAA